MSYSPQKKKKEKGDASKISSVFYQMLGEMVLDFQFYAVFRQIYF